jgi:hypothetical protein
MEAEACLTRGERWQPCVAALNAPVHRGLIAAEASVECRDETRQSRNENREASHAEPARRQMIVAAWASAMASAAGEDDPARTVGSIQVTVEPAALSIPQGSTGPVTVTLTRTGGFNGPVTIAVTGLPAGSRVSNPAVLTGAPSATVSLSRGDRRSGSTRDHHRHGGWR